MQYCLGYHETQTFQDGCSVVIGRLCLGCYCAAALVKSSLPLRSCKTYNFTNLSCCTKTIIIWHAQAISSTRTACLLVERTFPITSYPDIALETNQATLSSFILDVTIRTAVPLHQRKEYRLLIFCTENRISTDRTYKMSHTGESNKLSSNAALKHVTHCARPTTCPIKQVAEYPEYQQERCR